MQSEHRNMNVSIDTNIVLRLLINDIPQQYVLVHELLNKNKANRFHVADCVFVELEYALRMHYQLDRPTISNAIQTLISQKNIVSNKELFFALLPIYESKHNVSFVDCMLATYAQLNNAMPLYTFDKKLAQLPHTELLK